MASYTAQQMKKVLVEAGFEVFRSRPDEITLAERVRENLIMDSGVRLRFGEAFEVRVVMRAQHSDFPNDEEGALFTKVRELATPAIVAGFVELGAIVSPITEPGNAERLLDTFYEVTLGRPAPTLEEALESLRYALRLEKTASPTA